MTTASETAIPAVAHRDHPLPGRAGVVGGGRMGAGIAHALLLAGCPVCLVERDENAAEQARGRVTRALESPREAHPVFDVAQAVLFETQDKHDRMTAFLDRGSRAR